ncbi:hypothetical protein [Coralloluteibacterium stylophorae]|uniref:Uncharacterized protein n=1 Tax=Coralloluteibacterium stylophorae TaxID=1776034 RepID=A0A8J7VXP6_9GAMM|nr:hypothetical protein [Coralloluteibacterium stylophorae]MBS7457897.1 hypothetical protein [Coralloluteibacterium stylophorae]
MKKYPLGFAVLSLSAMLAGCGSQADCASGEVQETYLDIVGNLDDADAMEILHASVFQSVVTNEVDQSTGYRSCSATLVMENDADVQEREISYEVAQVESSDANFKVYANRDDIRSIRYTATVLAKRDRVAKKTTEMIEAAERNPYVTADEQDARDAGVAIGRKFFGKRLDEASVRATALDIEGDGVAEFVTAMKITYTSGDSSWYAFAMYQFPNGPGEKNSVGYAGEGTIENLGTEPSGHEMQGKSLYVTTAGGVRESLVYHTSTEGYQAYMKANAGG